MKRICVYGAGAIGGHVAARLISEGRNEVSVIARGAHLDAIKANGLWLETSDGVIGGRPFIASERPEDIPGPDLVIASVKSHSILAICDGLSKITARGTPVVFLINGIPWWWSHGRHPGLATERVDPGQEIWKALGPENAIGGVVYTASRVRKPGVIELVQDGRLILGEPLGEISGRLQEITDIFNRAGLVAEAGTDIRFHIWEKILLNSSISIPAALARLPLPDLFNVPGLKYLQIELLSEVVSIARAMDYNIPESAINKARNAANTSLTVYPSMLQDVLSSRPIEIEALQGQIHDFALHYGLKTPVLGALVVLARALNLSLTQR